MSRTSISSAGSLGVRIVTAKMAASPKRQPPRATDERDDKAPGEHEQAPPPPGMGKLVDRQA